MMWYYPLYFFIALFFSWSLIASFRFLAKQYQIVRKCDRDSSRELPLLGGAPLYFGFILAILLFIVLHSKSLQSHFYVEHNKFMAILIGAALVSLMGLIHDVHSIPLLPRITVHLLAAVLLVLSGIHTHISCLQIIPITIKNAQFFVGNILLSICWIILIISVIDLLEIFDGFVVGIGFLISLFLFAITIFYQDYANSILTIIVAGAMGSFFWYQLPPATMGLGKMGSGFIGFMLAGLSLNIISTINTLAKVLIPLLLFAVPLFITIVLFVYRLHTTSFGVMDLWNKFRALKLSDNQILTMAFSLTSLMGMIVLFILWIM